MALIHKPQSISNAGAQRVFQVAHAGAMQAPGGGETQLLATANALARLGYAVTFEPPQVQHWQAGDWVHFFGSRPEFLPLARAARERGARVAISTIAWFSLAAVVREPATFWVRGARVARFALRTAVPQIPSWRKRLYQLADVLLPNSQAEAEQLQRLFLLPAERIAVVPNAADARFAHGRPEPFQETHGLRDFVLYAGRVEPRKNQLGFLRAMRGAELPIVILGDVVPGHEDYLRQCQTEAGTNVRFVPRLAHDEILLGSCYAAARCLALTSWFETPGLVALEAGLTGAPLVLTNRGCAQEYFGGWARYVSPDDAAGIREQVLAAHAEPRSSGRAAYISRHFSWRAAALATAHAYARLPYSAFAEKEIACSRACVAGT